MTFAATLDVPVSNPCRPVKLGVSLKISIIFSVAKDGGFGAGPPPVLVVSLLKLENSFFAMDCRFFHLSLTSWTVRFATPTAFTASVISFQIWILCLFVTLFVSLLWIKEIFSSTLSVNRAISDAEKFCFLAFPRRRKPCWCMFTNTKIYYGMSNRRLVT